MKKTHDYIHHYRGYWSDGGRCRIRIYRENGQAPIVICSQQPDYDNTSITNMAECLAARLSENTEQGMTIKVAHHRAKTGKTIRHNSPHI